MLKREEESADDSIGDCGDKKAGCPASQSRTRAKGSFVNRESNRTAHHTWGNSNHTRITLGVLEHEWLSHKSGYHVDVEGFLLLLFPPYRDGSSRRNWAPQLSCPLVGFPQFSCLLADLVDGFDRGRPAVPALVHSGIGRCISLDDPAQTPCYTTTGLSTTTSHPSKTRPWYFHNFCSDKKRL